MIVQIFFKVPTMSNNVKKKFDPKQCLLFKILPYICSPRCFYVSIFVSKVVSCFFLLVFLSAYHRNFLQC